MMMLLLLMMMMVLIEHVVFENIMLNTGCVGRNTWYYLCKSVYTTGRIASDRK
jgi:hypothetical protein